MTELLSYIEGPTVTINFIDRNKNGYYASKYKLPKSISKFELYTIVNSNSDGFLLVHKETILKRDDSNLESFSDNDNIIIITDVYYPDDSYYNLLLKRTDEKINIFLKNEMGFPSIIIFPRNVKIGEFVNAFYLKYGLNDKGYCFLSNSAGNLLQDDNRSLYEIFNGSNTINISIIERGKLIGGRMVGIFGKTIIANVKIGELNKSFEIGLLNSTKHLIFESLKSANIKIVKKLIINGVEIKKERSLKSLGINKDFSCFIELKS